MHFAALALTVAAAADAGAPRSTFVLDNGVVRATFAGAEDREHELASIERVDDGRKVEFLTTPELKSPRSSACWAVLLRDRGAPLDASRCTWFHAGDPRFSVAREPSLADSADAATATTITYASDELEVGGARFRMVVRARWRLPPGAAFLEGEWSIEIPGLASLPFYVSQLTAPSLFIRYTGDASHRHDLVVPSQGGLLFEDPLGAPRFPRRFAGKGDARTWAASWVQVPLLAYYDSATLAGLYFSDDDVTGRFRDYEVARHEGEGVPYLELRCRHLPDDVYAMESWTIPYRARIAPLSGDWVDVARTYRSFLRDPMNGATFYKGPIGAREDVAAEMKELVFHAYVAPSVRTDSLDRMARDALDTTRLAGGGGSIHVWSAGFHPDEFEQFYFRGWLPGRPSLAAAVREAQSHAATIVAPYVNSSAGVDWVEAGVAEPTPLMRAIRSAAVVTEAGERFLSTLGPIPADGQCNGDPGWSRVFVENAADVVRRTGARSLYLDAFTSAPCFASAGNLGAHEGHAPGGGSYVHQGRVEQLRAIRASLAASGTPFAGFAMEGHCLWYIGDVDLMHLRPGQVAVTEGSDARGAPLLVENVKTIPLFRMVADSVKLAPFEDRQADTPGRHAWLDAVDVFAFGMLPNACNEQVDLVSSYGDEHLRERAPLERYLRRIAVCLRSGFLRWHNGTLERPPSVRIDAAGFAIRPGVERSKGRSPRNESWFRDVLVTAAYRGASPADGLAIVATNPWIATEGARAFHLAAEIDPSAYGLDSPADGYTVELRDETGATLQSWQRGAGEFFPISLPIPVGSIRYWVFRD